MDRVPTTPQDTSAAPEPGRFDPAMVPGARILGYYETFEINEGGFSYVLGLTDVRSGEKVAAKVPKPGHGRASSLEEFRREVAIWLDLPSHPNIVTARFVQELHGSPALFMDYIEGTVFRTARELMASRRLDLQTVIDFGSQICLGMEAASRDRELVHLDLKPENLMIDKGTIRIADFGLAHRVRVTNGAYEKRYAGSWPYAAPERFANEPCDSRADVYSLGVILYEMLTGTLPYPFELADDPADAYGQLRDFHADRGMSAVCSALGIPGDIGEVLTTFLSPWRDERGRSFREARRLMQELGARPATPDAEGFTTTERLARVEGLQAVGEHSTALTLLNRLLMEEPQNGTLYLAAARSLDATGNSESAARFRERALRIIRSGSL